MNNKIIRTLDFQGRLAIPKELLDFYGVDIKEKVAICSLDEDKVYIRNPNDLENCKVIAYVSIDEKGRIIMPSEIRKDIKKIEIYGLNGNLILEEAH